MKVTEHPHRLNILENLEHLHLYSHHLIPKFICSAANES